MDLPLTIEDIHRPTFGGEIFEGIIGRVLAYEKDWEGSCELHSLKLQMRYAVNELRFVESSSNVYENSSTSLVMEVHSNMPGSTVPLAASLIGDDARRQAFIQSLRQDYRVREKHTLVGTLPHIYFNVTSLNIAEVLQTGVRVDARELIREGNDEMRKSEMPVESMLLDCSVELYIMVNFAISQLLATSSGL